MKILMLFFLFFTLALGSADTLLLNGDFENTSVQTLPDGRLRFQGWTVVTTQGGIAGFYQEGMNGISAYNVIDSQYDNNAAGTDPFYPYVSSSVPNLDHFVYVRPSGPAPTSSYSEAYSDIFTKQGNITMDVWRESSGSFSEVRFHDATTNALRASFTFTGNTAVHTWTTVTLDVSGIADNTPLYIVLKGGTYQAGNGWLTFFDNIFGGVSQELNVPEAGGGEIVPEMNSSLLLCLGLFLGWMIYKK